MQTHSDKVSADGSRNLWRWFPMIVFAASAILMGIATRGDLALDEVVSLEKALNVKNWIEIVTQDQNDNNHLLNTFFLRLLGEQQHLFVYRIPSVLFGIGLVALLIRTSRRLGKDVSIWVACLAGLSYPIILYASEARGYAPAMFFAVASFELLQMCRERCTPAKLILFWASLILGFLSHFSFVIVCLALGVWTLVRDRLADVPLRGLSLNAIKYFGPPAIFLSGIYLTYIRHMIILGGLTQTWWTAIAETASYLLGFADESRLGFISVLFALALIISGLWRLSLQKRDEWIFFLLVLLVMPALVVGLSQPKFLYFRYFSVCFPFFYLLLASLFADWFRSADKMKTVPVLLLLAITTGHLVKVASLLHYGRGNYRQALYDMAAATPGPVISVSSDNDFRNGTMLNFYARFLPPSKTIEYIPQERRNQEPPDWIILQCFSTTFPAYPDVEVGHLGKYLLFATYPYCGSSGWAWFVYHRPAKIPPAQNQKPR
jgi:hypothetical protein